MTVAKMYSPVGQRQRRQDHGHRPRGAADHPDGRRARRDKPDHEGRVQPRQGLRPAINAKATASGIKAMATVRPPRISRR